MCGGGHVAQAIRQDKFDKHFDADLDVRLISLRRGAWLWADAAANNRTDLRDPRSSPLAEKRSNF